MPSCRLKRSLRETPNLQMKTVSDAFGGKADIARLPVDHVVFPVGAVAHHRYQPKRPKQIAQFLLYIQQRLQRGWEPSCDLLYELTSLHTRQADGAVCSVSI